MSRVLTAEQRARYQRDGILFPIAALAPGETARFQAAFEDRAARLGGRPLAQQLSQTHLYLSWAYELATHPAVPGAVEDVLGADILVWTAVTRLPPRVPVSTSGLRAERAPGAAFRTPPSPDPAPTACLEFRRARPRLGML